MNQSTQSKQNNRGARRINRLKNTISNTRAQPQYSDVVGKGLVELEKALKTNNEQSKEIKSFMKEMSAVAKGNATSMRGVRRNRNLMDRALYQFDIQKVMRQTGKDADEVLTALATSIPHLQAACGLSRSEALELIALDDFPEFLNKVGRIAGNVLSNIVPYGNLISEALPVVGDVVQGVRRLAGNSKQANDVEQIVSSKVNDPIHMNAHIYSPTLVDVDSLAYVLNPELSKGPARFDDAQPGAVYTKSFEFPIVPTTTGSAFVVINAAAVNALTSTAFSFITVSNADTVFNPTNGTWSDATGLTTFDCPLAAPFAAGTIDTARPVGLAMTYKSTVQNSTTYAVGQVDIYHDPSRFDGGVVASFASPSQYLALSNLGYMPFYQRGPITNEYSQCLYNPLDSYEMRQSADFLWSPIVMIFSGCNTASVQVGVVTVHVTYNVAPTPTGLSSLPVSNPKVGPYTADIMDSILTLAPELFMATAAEREDICKRIRTMRPEYSDLLKFLSTYTYTRRMHR